MIKHRTFGSGHLMGIRVVLKAAAFFAVVTALAFSSFVGGPDHTVRAQTALVKPQPTPEKRKPDYSRFSHTIEAHKKDCSACHKFPSSNWEKIRSEEDAFPDISDYPKHPSCVSCHRKQFFRGRKPVICSICHKNPSPNDSTRHPFPNPRELYDKSEKGKDRFTAFAVYFPHEMHVEMMSAYPPGRTNDKKAGYFVKAGFRRRVQSDVCATCHQTYLPQGDSDEEYLTKPPEDLGEGYWLKKGSFKSAPVGHTQCFTCHSENAGLEPSPADCGTCHKLKPKASKVDYEAGIAKKMQVSDKLLIALWRKRNAAAKFRHEWFSHADLECAKCHNISELNTVDPKIKPVPVKACSICHITETTDDGGALNYEVDERKKDKTFRCVKCHLSYGSQPIPESHTAAIKAQAGS